MEPDLVPCLIWLLVGMVVVFTILPHATRETHSVPDSTDLMREGDMVKARISNHEHHDGITEKLWMEIKEIIHHEKRIVCNIIEHPSLLRYRKKDDEVTIGLHQIEEYIRKDNGDVPYSYYVLLSHLY